jgi:hypothetical protein
MEYRDFAILAAHRIEQRELENAIITDDDNNLGGGGGLVFWINDNRLFGDGRRVTL